jgi:uncharacterized protein
VRGIDFFVYSRAAPGVGDVDDPALDEEHWSYMDRFADGMIARGPTFEADRATWNGSLHIVDLPSAEAARQFVEAEPYNRAGLFEQHLIRRFDDLLGRTMWEFSEQPSKPRFLVIAHLRTTQDRRGPALPPAFPGLPRERLIVHGELLTPDEAAPVGVALALQAATRDAVDLLLDAAPGGVKERFDIEIIDWEFGGRR